MSADYSFYALLYGYMPRPEGVQQKVRWFSIGFFVLYPRARTLNAPPFQGGREGVNKRAHDCASASSAVEPLRGYRKGKDESLSFFCVLLGSENPECASLSGRSGGCKQISTRNCGNRLKFLWLRYLR